MLVRVITDSVQLHLPQYEAHIYSLVTSSVSHHDRRIWLQEGTTSQALQRPLGEISHWTVRNVSGPLRLPPKIKDFLRRVVKKAIHVSANLETRGLPAFPCKRCGGI